MNWGPATLLPQWTWWRGALFRRRIGWHWTLLLAMVVCLFWCGHSAGWAWCWVGPLTWLGLITLRAVPRIWLAKRMGTPGDDAWMWAIGDDTFVRLPRRAWPRIIYGGIGSLMMVAVIAALMAATQTLPELGWSYVGPYMDLQHDRVTGWMVQAAMWLLIIHLLPIPPFDGAWLWRGLLLPVVGVSKAAIYATAGALAWFVLLTGLFVFFGQLVQSIFMVLWAYFTFLMLREIRSGFDPVEDAPLPPAHKDPGLIGRWRAASAVAAGAKAERKAESDDRILDALLAKVSADGLPALTDKERRQLQEISRRRKKDD